jgi:hypothetical protein
VRFLEVVGTEIYVLDHHSDRFRIVYTPEYEMSVDGLLVVWK